MTLLLLFGSRTGVGPVDIGVYITGPLGTYTPVITTPFPGTQTIGVAIPGPARNPIDRTDTTPVDPFGPPPERVMRIPGYDVARPEFDDDGSFNLTCQRGVSTEGSGSGSFFGPAPAQDEAVPVLVGGTVQQTFLVRQRVQVDLDLNEEAGQFVTVSGPGYVTELATVRVLPDLGGEDPTRIGAPAQVDRFFDWTASTGIDDTSWPRPVATDPLYGMGPGVQRFVPPTGLPYDVQWIAPRSTATGGLPIGDFYLRASFRIAAGVYNIFAFANDEHETWVDGVKVLERTGFYNGQLEKATITLSGNHFHFIAVRATNRGGRGGYGMVIMPINDTSVNGTPVVQTGVTGWKCLGYPASPPGMTAGKILRIIKAEAQVRGAWPGWTLMFDDTHDSAGQPWPTLFGYSAKVGTDFLTLLGQLADTDFDWVASPAGRQLFCYRKGNLPGSAVTILDKTGQQTTVDSTRVIDSLLVQYDGDDGNLYLPDPPIGGREGYVTLSGVKDRSQARRIGTQLLQVQSQPRRTVSPVPIPLGEGGPVNFDFDLGDVWEGLQIRELSITEADDGKTTVTPGLVDPLDVLEAQINRTIAKWAAGNMYGLLSSGDGRPTKPPTSEIGATFEIPRMGCHGFLSNVTEPIGPFAPERPCQLLRFACTLRAGGVTDTVIRLQINGENASATTIAAGTLYQSHTIGPGGILVLPGEQLTYQIESAGAGAQGLVISTSAAVA